jgi:hypothetical protein
MTRAAPGRALPPIATFSELVSTAVRAATQHVAEGSRRNARQALEVRYELARQGSEALAAVPGAVGGRRAAAAAAPQRRLTG